MSTAMNKKSAANESTSDEGYEECIGVVDPVLEAIANAPTASASNAKGGQKVQTGSEQNDNAVAEEGDDEVHQQLKSGQALLLGVSELKKKHYTDIRELKNKEKKMEMCEDGMDNLLEELERCERVKQKFESKQLDKISHCEEEAIKMAKELEHVDTREHIVQERYVNEVELYRNEMKMLARELANGYGDQRKSIEEKIENLIEAENKAKDELQTLIQQKQTIESESIEKEKELSDEERIARKRAAELEQVDDAGEREVQECASDLEFALEELDLAKDSLKKLAQKKEDAKLHLNTIIADEEVLRRRIQLLENRVEKEKSELYRMSDELGTVEEELEGAENLVKRLSREKKSKKKHAREELASESIHIREMRDMIEKINKERLALVKKAFELRAFEEKFNQKHEDLLSEEMGNKSDRKEKKLAEAANKQKKEGSPSESEMNGESPQPEHQKGLIGMIEERIRTLF